MHRRRFLVASAALVAACRSRTRRDGAATTPGGTPSAEDLHMTKRQRSALGALDDVALDRRRAFDGRGFAPLAEPGPNDWLAVHPEPGQSFDDFVAESPN